jgi:hypothetical protein
MNRNLLINGLIVVFAASAGFALSLKPWQVYKQQQKIADEAVAEMRSSEAQREVLVRKEARLKSSVGKEELARSRGWLPPGEVPAPK